MNIAIDARFYGLEHAGLGRYTLNLINELAKIDQDNTYTLFVWDKYKDLDLPDNFKTIIVNANHHSLSEQVLLAKAIGINRFDLVHFPHFIVPVLNLTTPFIVTIHDLIKHKFQGIDTTTLPQYQYQIKNMLYRFDIWWAAKRSRSIITPTSFVKDDVVRYYNLPAEKVHVIGEGVDDNLLNVDKSQQILDLKKPYFMYVGKSYAHKNVVTLINALEFLPDDYSLYLVGEKQIFWDRIVEKVQNKDLLNRVHHLGFLSDEELASVYKNAAAFASASYEEGFGLPPLEAMSLSCPLVLSDIPVHKEVCQDAALYFDADDSERLAKLLLSLGDKDENYSRRINAGLERVKVYSWSKMASDVLKLYQNYR